MLIKMIPLSVFWNIWKERNRRLEEQNCRIIFTWKDGLELYFFGTVKEYSEGTDLFLSRIDFMSYS